MRILGIGSGLFLLCLLWSTSILVLLLSGRAKTPYKSFGPLVLSVATCITLFFLLIPRSPVDESKSVDEPISNNNSINSSVTSDWMHFWRALIILINVIAACAGIMIIYAQWITKSMTRLRAPSVDFLQISEDGSMGTAKGKSKNKGKKDKKKEPRKKLENKEETRREEQEESS